MNSRIISFICMAVLFVLCCVFVNFEMYVLAGIFGIMALLFIPIVSLVVQTINKTKTN